jgi:Zn-dependent protease/predicted transcriptional regulator
MKHSWRVLRLFGIDIDVDASWIVIFVLFTWSLAGFYFPRSHPNWAPALNWGLGLMTSLMIFVSVLIHELAHSLVAIRQGEHVKNITLFILGGVSQITEEPDKPMKEFAMSVVGPLMSLVLAGVFFGVSLVLRPVSAPLGAAAGYLALINLILGVFNLLPGFPMDGGRVFRSIVWKVTGNLKKATRAATVSGQGFAFLLIFFGILQFLRANFAGLWFVLIGWFLYSSAHQVYGQMKVKEALSGVKARDIMTTDFETVPPGLSVQTLVDDYILKKRERVFLVGSPDDLRGIVCLEDVKSRGRHEWEGARVSDIMTPKDKLEAVGPDASGDEVLAKLAGKEVHQVPVLDSGRVKGLICRTDIIRVLQTRAELGLDSGNS